MGWTFASREKPFDRVIRLSNPIQLRNALMDPWDDSLVTVDLSFSIGGGLFAADPDERAMRLAAAKVAVQAPREGAVGIFFGPGSHLAISS
jgi:hypothetical protein